MPAIIVVDLGFGDAGKGSLVDYYVREYRASTVIRFNGGAQAAHNVLTPDGRHHTFAQFSSGTFVPGVRTHLSRFMLVDPIALLQEEKHLCQVGVTDAFERLSIDPGSAMVSPFQRAANRLRELSRGAARHGSCGMGIGETMQDMLADASCVLRARDLGDRPKVLQKLRFLQALKRKQMQGIDICGSAEAEQEMALLIDPHAPEEFAALFAHVAQHVKLVETGELLDTNQAVVFEGAQGVLLDEWYGFHPFTTWSTTTFANARTLLSESRYAGEVIRVGAIRGYMTRHGPGPFVTEDRQLTGALPDAYNGENPWQRGFRVGWPDLMMLQYALDVTGGVDELALTCMDRVAELPRLKVCCRYARLAGDYLEGDRLRVSARPDLAYQQQLATALQACHPVYAAVTPDHYVEWLQDQLPYPIGLTSSGPTYADKIRRKPSYRMAAPFWSCRE